LNFQLLKSFLKIIINKNKVNYLQIVATIITVYIVMTVLLTYINSVLNLVTDSMHPNFLYLYFSMRSVLIIGGLTIIINQYYNIMITNKKDYYILKVLGATKMNIDTLILLQIMLLISITIPTGMLCIYFIRGAISEIFEIQSINNIVKEQTVSNKTFIIIVSVAMCIIIYMGYYLAKGIRKTSLSSILSDHSNKEE